MLLQAQSIAHLTNWTYDVATNTFEFGENVKQILGYDRRTVASNEAMKAVHPKDQEQMIASWGRMLRSAETSLTYEYRTLVEGRLVWIFSRADVIRDAQGRAVRVVGISQDITERKRVEHQIEQLNIDLERRVRHRTAELTAANQELESFAYAVAHDLRSPLRAINGFSQALLEDLGDKCDEGHLDKFHRILNATKKMGGLIDGLLELSRHSRQILTPTEVDVTRLAQRILSELAAHDAQRQVDTQIEDGLIAFGDAQLIDALFHNLLENAWKYTARAPAAMIRVYSEESGGQRHIVVADNGVGFDMAHVEQMFKPFYRVHLQTEFPGIGIGLATAQRIVQRHGGSIIACGAPGLGASFMIALPLAEASPPAL